MPLSVENIFGLLIRSRLVNTEEAKSLYQRWLGEAKGAAADVELFQNWLVSKRYLTAYQAEVLVQGMADHFFLDQYKILDRIGEGCMAGVFKAVHNLGQIVAIKVLPPSKAKNPPLMGRFQREARLALKLKHPNVVRAFQVGECNGVHYLVMECLEGETLREVLQRRGQLPPAEGVRLIYQALLGLQHFHEKSMVHRDLKPDNLMLIPGSGPVHLETTAGVTVKILDVGLARAIADDRAPENHQTEHLTSEGVMLGTPDYMAPEQARDAHSADIRSDIYSMGCVLYHTLTGQPPFPDKNIINQMIRHQKEPARPLKEFNPEIPDGLQQIINWMMAKDPAQRYPVPERAAQALEMFLAAGTATASSAEPTPQMSSYLTWLEADAPRLNESENPRPSAEEPAETEAIRAANPIMPTPVILLATPGQTATDPPPAKEEPRRKPSSRNLKSKQPSATSETGQAADPEPSEVDVELVLARTAEAVVTLPIKEGIDLSRRDLIMLGIGAGGILSAVFAGLMVAKITKRKPIPQPPADDEKPGEGDGDR